MSTRHDMSRRPAGQRGLSLVELMVGITVGLFVVAGAVLVASTQLGDNRRLLLETQLQQDLRATSDIITRELRRAGASGDPARYVWFQGLQASPNTYNEVAVNEDENEVLFNYRRNQQEGGWGFKWDGDAGVIKTLIGDRWQDLTDPNTMVVNDFRVETVDTSTHTVPCPRACSADLTDTACWPTVTVRSYLVTIAVAARSDPSVQRVVRSQVRLRNDEVKFTDAANPDRACPP